MEEFDFSRCREYPFASKEAMVAGFYRKGDVVYYNGVNGMSHDQQNIEKAGITKDTPLTVERIHVGDWSSTYRFKEYPDKQFNTVCFSKRVDPPKVDVVIAREQYVYVVSIDDHPTAVFSNKLAVIDRFPELKFEEITPGFWKAFSKEQYNTVYVERFLVQHDG